MAKAVPTEEPIATATLKLVKETKGALRYDNVEPEDTITNIYLRKDGVDQPYPQSIVLTVTVAK